MRTTTAPVRFVYLVWAVALALQWCASPAGAESAEPNTAMREAFSALSQLFPVSLDEKRFSDPQHREEIEKQFRVLSSAAAKIESHGQRRDGGFQELSELLLEDSEQAARFFRERNYEDARAFVYMLVQNCIDCHTRFPSGADFPFAARLVGELQVEKLSEMEQARLQVVSRSFDKSLQTWEGIFQNPRSSPVELDLAGQPFEYLRVALRVRQNPARARGALEQFRARDDVPSYLRNRLSIWIEALKALEAAPPEQTLEAARQLSARGASVTLFQDSREGLVYDLMASGILLRMIDAARESETLRAQLSEAYFLLARLEDRLTQSFWSGQTESYLEAAVRSPGNERVGWNAYWRLEELVTAGFGAHAEVALPERERRRLRELRQLLPPRE